MSGVEREIRRILDHLRRKIRDQGFTQLEVQEDLGWGRSYISQLVTGQKSLRMDQLLLILDVIGVQPGEFFGELYARPRMGGLASVEGGETARALARNLIAVLIDSEVVTAEELNDLGRVHREGLSAGGFSDPSGAS